MTNGRPVLSRTAEPIGPRSQFHWNRAMPAAINTIAASATHVQGLARMRDTLATPGPRA
jgi:hypothetical protein